MKAVLSCIMHSALSTFTVLLGPKRTGELSSEVATGCALLKGENDPPLKSDNEYPDWLWRLLDPRPTASELQKLYEGQQGLTIEQVRMQCLTCVERLDSFNVVLAAPTTVPAEKQGCN